MAAGMVMLATESLTSVTMPGTVETWIMAVPET